MENQEAQPVKKKGGRPKSRNEIKKRVGLAVYPSMYDRITKMAYVERLSINEMMCRMFEEYLNNHSEKLKEYKTLKDEEERLNKQDEE